MDSRPIGSQSSSPIGSQSLALWVPTLWILILASRPVGRWLDPSVNDYSEGSVLDQLVLIPLLVSAFIILTARTVDWSAVLRDNLWLILLLAYAAFSVLWSDATLVSLKRWVKVAGTVVMGFVIYTERDRIHALETVLRRIAYLLVPLSVILVKYVPLYGRTYGRWDGAEMWTGVATHKNGLGQLCAVSAAFLLWDLLFAKQSKKGTIWFADVAVLITALFLLLGPSGGTYSATSLAITGGGFLVLALLRWKGIGRGVISALPALYILAGTLYYFLGDFVLELVAEILERRTDLTGRATDIWPAVISIALRNPVLGTGYGGVWGLGDELSRAVEVEEAHNGYLEIFLQLGIVGLALLLAFLLACCSKIRRQMRSAYGFSAFAVFILTASLIYNNTESSFMEYTSYLWTMMVLSSILLSPPHLPAARIMPGIAARASARRSSVRSGRANVRSPNSAARTVAK